MLLVAPQRNATKRPLLRASWSGSFFALACLLSSPSRNYRFPDASAHANRTAAGEMRSSVKRTDNVKLQSQKKQQADSTPEEHGKAQELGITGIVV